MTPIATGGGEELSVMAGAPSPPKKSSHQSPKGPNNPTSPANPILPTHQTGQTSPTDQANPTDQAKRDRFDKPDRPQHGQANRISPRDAERRPAPRANSPNHRRRPRRGPGANSLRRLNCGGAPGAEQIGAALRSTPGLKSTARPKTCRGFATVAPNRRDAAPGFGQPTASQRPGLGLPSFRVELCAPVAPQTSKRAPAQATRRKSRS